MITRRSEALGLVDVRKAIKKQDPLVRWGMGWKRGESLGLDFQAISSDLLTWFQPEQRWALDIFHLRLNNQDPPKRLFREPVDIVPDELTLMFGFSAKNPPLESSWWKDPLYPKLDLAKVFNYDGQPEIRRILVESGMPEGGIVTNQLGPLLDRNVVLRSDSPECPYYFNGYADVYRTTAIEQALFTSNPEVNDLVEKSPQVYLSVEIQAYDLLDESRRVKNEARRFSDRLNRKFPLA